MNRRRWVVQGPHNHVGAVTLAADRAKNVCVGILLAASATALRMKEGKVYHVNQVVAQQRAGDLASRWRK